jgi:tetratricopeptide (TPR) repeat protein
MPAHIYLRVGRFADAAEANERAIAADEDYLAQCQAQGLYPVSYYPHNLHFLWAVAAFDGRRAVADSAMLRLRAIAPAEVAVQVPPLEAFQLPPFYHMVWFGKWDEILREPRPAPSLKVATGLWTYARGRAFTATGRLAEARRELDTLTAMHADVVANTPPGLTLGLVPPASLLSIAKNVLAGELAGREGRTDEAVARLREAIQVNDGFLYTEPADWYYPPRLSLGAVLLDAGRAADAEAVYREDLARNRNNGWALTGLEKALTAQGKTAEATRVRAQLRQAWARADVQPANSRF